MTLKNTSETYGWLAKAFHWLMAVAIIGMLALGFYMSDLPLGLEKLSLYGKHKAIGSLILIAVFLRLLWRIINTTPKLPNHMKKIEVLAAHLGHFGLYVLMFVMPLSGWLMSSAAGFQVSVFEWFKMPDLILPNDALVKILKEVHELAGYALVLLVIVHASAALFHHFYYKDTILKRMLPWVK